MRARRDGATVELAVDMLSFLGTRRRELFDTQARLIVHTCQECGQTLEVIAAWWGRIGLWTLRPLARPSYAKAFR